MLWMNPNHSTPIPPPCPPAISLQMLCDAGGKESSSLSIPLLAKAWGCRDSKDEQWEGDSLQSLLMAPGDAKCRQEPTGAHEVMGKANLPSGEHQAPITE